MKIAENFFKNYLTAVESSVERILGKDEVPGPNPGSSSKKTCNRNGYRFFLFLILLRAE